ncbi:MAG TPA: hypothetical protein VLK33_10385 [Terriglobales bacterium]|nr:hypothetical protein [Terriglobales bacterium]
MPLESDEPLPNFTPAVVDVSNPPKITDLIELLDHDLVETKKNTSRRR